MSEGPEKGPEAQPPTGEEKRLVDDSRAPAAHDEPARAVIPRWIQLAVLPVALLAVWALANVAGQVLVLFIVAGLIALILNPAVAFLQRRRLPRGLAVLAVYVGFFLALGGIGFLVANPISNQVQKFANNLPHLVNEANENIASLQEELNEHGIHLQLVKQGKTALQTIQDKVAKSASKLASSGAGLLTEAAGAIFDLVLIFVLSVYMLLYGEQIGRLAQTADARRRRHRCRRLPAPRAARRLTLRRRAAAVQLDHGRLDGRVAVRSSAPSGCSRTAASTRSRSPCSTA